MWPVRRAYPWTGMTFERRRLDWTVCTSGIWKQGWRVHRPPWNQDRVPICGFSLAVTTSCLSPEEETYVIINQSDWVWYVGIVPVAKNWDIYGTWVLGRFYPLTAYISWKDSPLRWDNFRNSDYWFKKHKEINLLHEIRGNKQLQKNTRTDEQINQQYQKYEHVDSGREVDIVAWIDHPCITKILEVYDEEAYEPTLAN